MIRAAVAGFLLAANLASAQNTAMSQQMCVDSWAALAKAIDLSDATRDAARPRPAAAGFCAATDFQLTTQGIVTEVVFDRVEWRGAGFDRFVQKSLPPTSLLLRIDGMRVTTASNTADFGPLSYEPFDVAFMAAWDADSGAVDLQELTLSFDGGDHVTLRSKVDGIDLSTMASMQASLGNLRIKNLSADIASDAAITWVIDVVFGRIGALRAIEKLPETVFTAESKLTMQSIAGAGNGPHSALAISAQSKQGLGVLQITSALLSSAPIGSSKLEQLLDGVQVSVVATD